MNRLFFTVRFDASGKPVEFHKHGNLYSAMGYAQEIVDHAARYGVVAGVAVVSGVFVPFDSGEEVRV